MEEEKVLLNEIAPIVPLTMIGISIWGTVKAWGTANAILIIALVILTISAIVTVCRTTKVDDTSTMRNKRALKSTLWTSILFAAFMGYILYLL